MLMLWTILIGFSMGNGFQLPSSHLSLYPSSIFRLVVRPTMEALDDLMTFFLTVSVRWVRMRVGDLRLDVVI